MRTSKKTVFIDMDGVLVDFVSAFQKLDPEILEQYKNNEDEIPHIFGLMEPMPDAIESYHRIAHKYDTYILSTAPWENSSAWHDKVVWVKKHLGTVAYKRLILSHNKHLCKGDYLIDDRHDKNGSDKFDGELIHFTSERFSDWKKVCEYLEV